MNDADPEHKPVRHLEVLPATDLVASSLASDGKRKFVYPADVHGRFAWLRRAVFALLLATWVALPLITIGGKPALFLDVERRSFYVFGATFNAQDVWLMFFVITGTAFAIAFVTSLLGRVWCGYACPQTVFLDGLFRPIERLIEGPRDRRMRRDAGPWTGEKVVRKVIKHALYLLASFFVAHVFLSFFVSVPAMLHWLRGSPSEHPEAFAWAAAMTLLFYGNFAWFREQLCLIVCPYGRLQSILFDDDSLVIGYDEKRGEPRGKASDKSAGDCVDCRRCVVVCPTGIDIRNGLQLDCIACTACIDACDEIMVKLKRPKGLVRYDSQRGLAGQPRRVLRPRMLVYAVLGLVGLLVAGFAAARHTSFEVTLLRDRGAPFVAEGDEIRNSFTVHVVNKHNVEETFVVEAEPLAGATFNLSAESVTVPPMGNVEVRVVVRASAETAKRAPEFHIKFSGRGETRVAKGKLLGPGG